MLRYKNSSKRRLPFVNRLFIVCSFAVLYLPALRALHISTECSRDAARYNYCTPVIAVDTPSAHHLSSPLNKSYQDLKYLQCCWQKKLYKTGAVQLTDSRGHKVKQSLFGGVQGLTLLVCCGFSFVYTVIFLLVFFAIVLSEQGIGVLNYMMLSFPKDTDQFRNGLMVLTLLLTNVQRFPCILDIDLSIVRNKGYPKSVISMRLLLSGDVEENPGPIYGKRERRHSCTDITLNPKLREDTISSISSIFKTERNVVARKEEIDRIDEFLLLSQQQKILSKSATNELKKLNKIARSYQETVNDKLKNMKHDVPNYTADSEAALKEKFEAVHAQVDKDYGKMCHFLRKENEILRREEEKYKQSPWPIAKPQSSSDVTTSEVPKLQEEFSKLINDYLNKETYTLHSHQQQQYIDDLLRLVKMKSGTGNGEMQLILNQIYINLPFERSEELANNMICAFCSDSGTKNIQSHIWPNSLLDAFKKIHGDRDKRQFQLSHTESGLKAITPKHIALPMFCEGCDRSFSDKEKQLKRLYLFISGYPDHALEFDNTNFWLHHILAVIMVRGILMSCNLIRIRNQDINSFTIFLDLINYATAPQDRSESGLSVYLLPNDWYKNLEIFPAFERELRYPAFTSIYDLAKLVNKNGRFYYMQFDCIHVVYPVDTDSKSYFSQFPPSDVPNRFPSTEQRKRVFPPALLAVNLSRALENVVTQIQQANPGAPYSSLLAIIHQRQSAIELRSKGSYTMQGYQYKEQAADSTDEHVYVYNDEVNEMNDEVSLEERRQLFEKFCIKLAQKYSALQKISMNFSQHPNSYVLQKNSDLFEHSNKLLRRITNIMAKIGETNIRQDVKFSLLSDINEFIEQRMKKLENTVYTTQEAGDRLHLTQLVTGDRLNPIQEIDDRLHQTQLVTGARLQHTQLVTGTNNWLPPTVSRSGDELHQLVTGHPIKDVYYEPNSTVVQEFGDGRTFQSAPVEPTYI